MDNDMNSKRAAWAGLMRHARAQGWKFIPPDMNPLLYDDDFEEIATEEKAKHEARKAQADRAAADKAARKLEKAAKKSAKEDK